MPMIETARAAIFEAPGVPLQMRSVPLPSLTEGETLVRVRLATICGSDLHTYEGRRTTPCPTILGHEILGTIIDLGPPTPTVDAAGQALAVGDRVTWPVIVACGACFFCRHDLPQKCERLFKYGHERVTDRHFLNGGLASHCLLKQGTHVLRVPDCLPDAVACPASCATATVAAALVQAGNLTGQVVLIQGAGMLGLTASAWASTLGARAVLVCDPNQWRLELARNFGASGVAGVEDDHRELRRDIVARTEGRGVDIVIEMSGSGPAIALGIDLLRCGGRAVWVGAVFPTAIQDFVAERVVRKCLTIHGVHNYRPADLAAALRFLEAHHAEFPFAELVGPAFALDDVQQAFESARTGTVLRAAVAP